MQHSRGPKVGRVIHYLLIIRDNKNTTSTYTDKAVMESRLKQLRAEKYHFDLYLLIEIKLEVRCYKLNVEKLLEKGENFFDEHQQIIAMGDRNWRPITDSELEHSRQYAES